MAVTKAKRGDIAVIVTERHDYYIGQPNQVRTEVEVAEVASVTREGLVKAVQHVWQDADGSLPVARMLPHDTYIVPRTEIDVPAALDSARAHHWPGHPGQPMAYASLDEVRDMLRAHRLTSKKAA